MSSWRMWVTGSGEVGVSRQLLYYKISDLQYSTFPLHLNTQNPTFYGFKFTDNFMELMFYEPTLIACTFVCV